MFFSTILSQSHIRTPGPTKADKTFRGPKSFFPRSCPSHIFEPLVPQKPTKLSGAPKGFFRDPTKADKTFRGPKRFFPRSCPSHIFEPLVPQKPTKLSGAPKVFFHDPVPVTYSNPWSHKSRQNFPGPQQFFCARTTHTHWDKHPPPNPTSRPW